MFRSYPPDFIVFVYLFSLKLFQSAFKAVSLVYGLYILELGVERDSFGKARLDEKGRHNSRDKTGHFSWCFLCNVCFKFETTTCWKYAEAYHFIPGMKLRMGDLGSMLSLDNGTRRDCLPSLNTKTKGRLVSSPIGAFSL